ncbi:pentapeptide repeat-containing protein [Solwaraspora sp. WMMA2101]|uniref:pentapeptide repeat-containing protein n=1 Tax=Solwaraspora sp. WMMA2101 TaxID=3404124 RepID=UPI003B944B61
MRRTTVTGTPRFDGATFTSTPRFDGATFESGVTFGAVRVEGDGRASDVWPAGWQVDLDTRRVVRVPVEEKPEGDAEPE